MGNGQHAGRAVSGLAELRDALRQHESDRIDVVERDVPGPKTQRLIFTKRTPHLIQGRWPTLRQRLDPTTWVPGIVITAADCPGEVHAIETEPAATELTVSLLEPEGYHPTGHDAYWTVKGDASNHLVLAKTSSAEMATIAVLDWVRAMRTSITPPSITFAAPSAAFLRARQRDVDAIDRRRVDHLLREGLVLEALAAAGFATTLPHDELPDEARRANEAIAAIDPARVFYNAPRSPNGRLISSARIQLVRLAEGRPTAKHPWLVARPLRGTDTARFLIRVEHLHDDRNPHRWDIAPWLWQRDYPRPDTVSGNAGSGSGRKRSLELLKAGRIVESFTESGVPIGPRLLRLMQGRSIGYRLEGVDQDWVPAAFDIVVAMAPWLIRDRAASFVRDTYSGHLVSIPLGVLPNQHWIRRARVSLFVPRTAAAYLDIDWTGSSRVLPWALWRRPVDWSEES